MIRSLFHIHVVFLQWCYNWLASWHYCLGYCSSAIFVC